jgi:hypothetical protein
VKRKNNAKNNAKIMQNNAGAGVREPNPEPLMWLHLRDLRLEIGPGAGFFNNLPFLVNNWVGRPSAPQPCFQAASGADPTVQCSPKM